MTDPRNGEILALVSNPSYDPNLFVGGISNTDYQGLLNNPDRPLINRTTQGLYPPASTVKPFMSVAALSERCYHCKHDYSRPRLVATSWL